MLRSSPSRHLFHAAVLLPFLLVMLMVVAITVLLWRSGELSGMDTIVRLQHERHAIWSEMSDERESAYKIALYEAAKPDVVAIGSSRMLQVRSVMFDASFVNMGRGLDLHRIADAYGHLGAIRPPELILWGVDNWWPSETRFRNSEAAASGVEAKILGGRSEGGDRPIEFPSGIFVLLADALRSGKVGLADISDTILGRTGDCIGLRACMVADGGYAPDGSYRYLQLEHNWSGQPARAAKLVETRVAGEEGYGIAHGERVSDGALREFEEALRRMKTDGVEVFVFLPPFPPRIAAMYQRNPAFRSYTEAMARAVGEICGTLGFPFKDYTDPRVAGIGAAEFYDAIHPTDSAMAKVLLDASTTAMPSLRPYLDLPTVERIAASDDPIAVAEPGLLTP